MSRILFGFLFIFFLIYSFIVYVNGTAAPSGNEMARRGKLLFQEKNCIACHQIYGLGGFLGADLTNVISANGKGLEYAKVFLRNGTDRMPDYKFSEDEINNLIEYLKYIDKTAITYKRENIVE